MGGLRQSSVSFVARSLFMPSLTLILALFHVSSLTCCIRCRSCLQQGQCSFGSRAPRLLTLRKPFPCSVFRLWVGSLCGHPSMARSSRLCCFFALCQTAFVCLSVTCFGSWLRFWSKVVCSSIHCFALTAKMHRMFVFSGLAVPFGKDSWMAHWRFRQCWIGGISPIMPCVDPDRLVPLRPSDCGPTEHSCASGCRPRAAGLCLLTLQPQLRGGGQKDQKYEKLLADLAQQGVTLADASSVVDKLMPQAGAARVQRALAITNPANRWQQITALCSQYGVLLPPTTARLDKAAKRTQQEAKRRAQARTPAQASDFQVQPGYCFLADGSEAVRLSSFFPGCSGALLIDAPAAAAHLSAAPCIDCLGQSAHISVTDNVCVLFSAFRDEWEPSVWQRFLQNPVRQTVEALQASGASRPFELPFGRSFHLQGKAAAPNTVDCVLFSAQVPRAGLDGLLRRSGFEPAGLYG